MFSDTIFALSSGALPSAIAVVRIAGPNVTVVLERLVGFVPEPRRLILTSICDDGGEEIDKGFVAYFAAPYSFTGEDAAELQVHGSKAVVSALSRTLSAIPGLRPADAGEFSRRAHLNGKFDLTGAEALADLIAAETEEQRRFALGNARGRNAQLYQDWRRRLISARAMIEAELDFADEDDVQGGVGAETVRELTALRVEIENHIGNYRTAEIIREGFQVALVGPPNAGKSSLLNALVKRDAAIVSDEPGTTRDLVVVNLDLGGLKVVLTDTAGIRDGAGAVEQQGIERAREAAKLAQLVLVLHDITAAAEERTSDDYGSVMRVCTKVDLSDPKGSSLSDFPGCDILVSVKTGRGLPQLLELIGQCAANAVSKGSLVPFRERHVAELSDASRLLGMASQPEELDLALRAELLRRAGFALGKIIGDVDVEDILDVIFSRFCIGK